MKRERGRGRETEGEKREEGEGEERKGEKRERRGGRGREKEGEKREEGEGEERKRMEEEEIFFSLYFNNKILPLLKIKISLFIFTSSSHFLPFHLFIIPPPVICIPPFLLPSSTPPLRVELLKKSG